MALDTIQKGFLLSLAVVFACFQISIAGDADITSDFLVPPNATNITGGFFTYTGLRALHGPKPTNFTVTKATMAEFPALNGQSVSYAVLQFPAGSVNPPHSHPRAAELLFVGEGVLDVGVVDTTNKLYTQTLQAGDMFVFPKALVHYQYNSDPAKPATAISSFGSASPGTVSVPATLLATGIDDTILAKAFKTDATTIEAIKKGFAPKA